MCDIAEEKTSRWTSQSVSEPEIQRNGGCHCGAVRYEVWAPVKLNVIQCSCSVCVKKQNHHFIVPASKFKLLQGSHNLTSYTFNTHKAKHTFCSTCGVQSFYTPRSNPDGYGIMPHCLDQLTVAEDITVQQFDGRLWEESMKENPSIKEMSKDKENNHV